MKLFLVADTGQSGHGTVGREFMSSLVDSNVKLNVSTHFWGLNLRGWSLGIPSRQFPDMRLREKLIRENRINHEYYLTSLREARFRPHTTEDFNFHMDSAVTRDLMIKDFDGREDINLALGSMGFAHNQPTYCPTITETTVNTTIGPERWIEESNLVDEIWVPTKWSRDAMIRTGLDKDKVKVMPYGVEFHKPTFNDKICKLNDSKFTFGVVGRWVNLKAMNILLEAYLEEFVPSEDNVRLFIKTTVNGQFPLNGNMINETINTIIGNLRIYDPCEVGISSEPITTQEYWDMLGALDCFVLPSRAESIGISNVQAMGIGIPTISTDYSVMKEYLDDTTGFPIKCEEVDVEQHCDLLYFYGEEHKGKWANPDKEHLKEQMRKVYEMSKNNPEKLQSIANKGKERVRKMYDWDVHTKARIKRMEELI